MIELRKGKSEMVMFSVMRWWSEGLVKAWLSFERRMHNPAKFRLPAGERPLVLLSDDDSTVEPVVVFSQEGAEEVLGDFDLQRTRRSSIEILVPPAAILSRRLDPLPAESRQYVDGVVKHQLDAIFPWSSEDVVYAASVDDREDGRIDVTVHATAGSTISEALSAARRCEAAEIFVCGIDERGGAVRIPVPGASSEGKRIETIRTAARYAIIALLIVMAGIASWNVLARWSLNSDIDAVDQLISERRATLARAANANGRAGDESLESRKQKSPVVVVAIEELSKALPDDTYLTDLSFEGGSLRISGLSRRAEELVNLLEESGRFERTTYSAPITRMSGGGADRFSIETVVASRKRAVQ